jgi:hypothetical protein
MLPCAPRVTRSAHRGARPARGLRQRRLPVDLEGRFREAELFGFDGSVAGPALSATGLLEGRFMVLTASGQSVRVNQSSFATTTIRDKAGRDASLILPAATNTATRVP